MELPDMIAALFDAVYEGVLIPLLEGFYSIGPAVIAVAVVVSLLALVFSQRKTQAAWGLVLTVGIFALWCVAPTLLEGVVDWTVDAVSAETSSSEAAEISEEAAEEAVSELSDVL